MMFKDFLKTRMPIQSQAKYVEFGYGQVEPNHLSAQRTAQIYAQLPADPSIEILEQGQFVKYDYAANDNGIGLVDFTGAGEWMLVYNEIKLYRNLPDGSKQWDCEFAMIKDDYQARIYSPYDYENAELEYKDWHRLNLVDGNGDPIRESTITVNTYATLDVEGKTVTIAGTRYPVTDNKFTYNGTEYTLDENGTSTEPIPVEYPIEDVTKDKEDYYEWGFTNDPWRRLGLYREKRMPAGTQMVPRVFKTNVGDIFTTNTIDEEELAVGDVLCPRDADGILVKNSSGPMKWQVVKVYTMPDNQKGVKIMRIA